MQSVSGLKLNVDSIYLVTRTRHADVRIGGRNNLLKTNATLRDRLTV